jgi:hypothetical protein
MYVKYVLVTDKDTGQSRLVPHEGVSLFFETTNGGQARSEIAMMDIDTDERSLDHDLWGAVFKPLSTELCTRSAVYKKAYSDTIFVGVSKLNGNNALEFFMEVSSGKGASKDKWNLRSDKGQIKDIQLNSETQVCLEIKTEGINTIAKLLPFWENVSIYLEHMGLFKIDANFDNDMGKGSICYALTSQEPPCT